MTQTKIHTSYGTVTNTDPLVPQSQLPSPLIITVTYTGSRGYSGSRGQIGFTGSYGANGPTGSRGYVGSRGDIGASGLQGSRGYVGSIGYTGPRGYTGSLGNLGYSGSIGNLGYSGSKGATGFVGNPGATGATGSPGGATGPIGATGLVGASGATGVRGATGFAGLGYTGSAGVGSTGATGVGSTGATGAVGYTGSASAGVTVDKIYLPAITRLTVTASGSSAYLFDQYSGNNPTIYAISGTTISFDLGTGALSSHPFLIRYAGADYNTGLTHVTSAGVVTTGSLAQGKTSGTLYWKIPASISGAYGYLCSAHGTMVGTITIKDISAI